MTAIIYFLVGVAITAVLSAFAAILLRRRAVAQAEQTMRDRTVAECQSAQVRLETERDNALKQVEVVKADMQQRIEQEQFNETMAKVSNVHPLPPLTE